jgi:cyclin H
LYNKISAHARVKRELLVDCHLVRSRIAVSSRDGIKDTSLQGRGMAQYSGSTQESHWLLTSDEVAARRKAAVEASRPRESALSLEEECTLRRHHERRILRFTQRIDFPPKVAASAISYFKRFFLDRSVLDYNPAIIALSSLYASFKVEEVIISADDLVARADVILNGVDEKNIAATESLCGTAMRVTAEALLTTELSFLHLLDFHLICYHPYRSLTVLYERIAADKSLPHLYSGKDEGTAARDSLLEELFSHAHRTVTRRTLLTDVQFTHSPAAIAIAAVISAAHELQKTRPAIDPAALHICLLASLDAEASSVLDDLTEVIRGMAEGGATDDAVRLLEVRRRALCNPENDPTSEVYRQREREKIQLLDDKRMKKAQAHKEAMRQKTEALMGFGGGSNGGQDDRATGAGGDSEVKRIKTIGL